MSNKLIKKIESTLSKKTLTYDEHIDSINLVEELRDAIDKKEVKEKEIKEK